jgi:hypothetical protein
MPKLVVLLGDPLKNDLDRLYDFYLDLFQVPKAKASFIYYERFMILVDVKLSEQVGIVE